MKKTMRQHSFTTRLTFLAVVFGIAMAFASCANEDVAQNLTNPNEDNGKNFTTFVAGDETKTRTSMDSDNGDFYWEAGDYIYVKDDNNVWQKSSNAPTSRVASFKYKVTGKFTASTSYKIYYLGKNSSGNAVTISSNQYQTSPDNTEHFGTVGDYGFATATGTLGGKSFSFTLEHQPAYLVFQPYTSNTVLNKCYLTKVEVTSDNDIAETYTINTSTDNLDASAGGKQIILTTGGGFPLTNNSTSKTTNGAYMIIKPGTHTLKIRYWVKDLETHIEGAITKLLPSTTYVSNTYYDITANLNAKDYDGDHYCMWDAEQQYWYGYEWTRHLAAGTGQPTLAGDPAGNYAQNNGDSNHRFYNESYPGYGISNPATHSCATLPNANEMSWYIMYGDPRWDEDEAWTTMGHLYKGGMWFKKKSVLTAEGHYDTEKSADGSTDMRINESYYSKSGSSSFNSGLPSAANANKYFFLPASGYYYGGVLYYLDQYTRYGKYWSSTADPKNSDRAYYLIFRKDYCYLSYENRQCGNRAQKFSDFGDN